MRKSILFLAPSFFTGGSERQLYTLVTQLLENDYRVAIWCLRAEGPFLGKYEDLGVNILGNRYRYRVAQCVYYSLVRAFSVFRPDIIHSWLGGTPHICAYVLSILYSKPIISSVRKGLPTPDETGWRRLVYRFGDCVVSNTISGLISYSIPKSRGLVIRNALDFRRTSTKGSLAKLGIRLSADSLIVAMVASFSALKDQACLLDAFVLIAEDFPTMHIFFAGDGPNLIQVKRSVPMYLKGRVHFLGEIEEPFTLLSESDIGVLMSKLGEGFSNSIMEYMAAELPVVCSDNGALREMVIQDVNGFLIRPGDYRALADVLINLARNENLRQRLGQRGYQMVSELTPTSIAADYQKLYKELINRHARV